MIFAMIPTALEVLGVKDGKGEEIKKTPKLGSGGDLSLLNEEENCSFTVGVFIYTF